jgi:hypothetical protein
MFGDDVVLTRPVNSEPFVEQYTHTLTGVTGTIELNLDYDWSACSIPASWNYNTPTDSPSDGWGALQFIESLDQSGVFVSLLNDEEAPGNSYYYGTDGSGIKGWYAIVDNIGLTCETLPDCAVIIGIVDDIIALQTDVALKANTADLGATAFSNDYGDLDNLPTIPAAQVNSDWNSVSGVSEILNKPTIPSIAGLVPDTRTISTTAPITGGGDLTANRTLSIPQATTLVDGYLSATDWTTFNAKQNALGFTPVPSTRSLTINGTTQDLSADRTFTIATGLTVGTTPITSGTVGRVLFEGTGNVLQESANLTYDTSTSTFLINTKLSVFSNASGTFLYSNEELFIGTSVNRRLAFFVNNTEAMRIATTTRNVLIGTTTDAGYKLDVNGTARVSGELTLNSSIRSTQGANLNMILGTFALQLSSGNGQNTNGTLITTGDITRTDSGTKNVINVNNLVSSTAASFNVLNGYAFTSNITQTQGTIRGLLIAPTLTASTDFRAIEITAGISILAPSRTQNASLRIPSGTAPTSPVNGDIWFDGTNLNVRIGGVTRTIVVL